MVPPRHVTLPAGFVRKRELRPGGLGIFIVLLQAVYILIFYMDIITEVISGVIVLLFRAMGTVFGTI